MKPLFTIFCIAFFTLSVIAQEDTDQATIRCYYRFIQKKKAGDKEIFLHDTLTLDMGSQMSRYYDESKIQRDSKFGEVFSNLDVNRIKSLSIMKEQDANFLDHSLGDTYRNDAYDGISEQIYKNRKSGKIIMLNSPEGGLSRDWYKSADSVRLMNWTIMPDTAGFFNYSCQKATLHFRGRNYEAWFTSQISINDGPWKFSGLPGLILKVKDADGQFDFECIGLERLSTPYVIEIPKYKYFECNRKDYNKAVNKKGGGSMININGGNVTIVTIKADSSIQPIELE